VAARVQAGTSVTNRPDRVALLALLMALLLLLVAVASSKAAGRGDATTLRGVAHRTLPCGTPVVLADGRRLETVPVVDCGPYTAGFVLDLEASAARVLRPGGSGAVRALY
jgi:rare lipoprotein A (peptidoglycan hydrolase)